MDNLKTGAFIKSCRKEKKMTQKELADRLHVTDRAVSKWERGLSAPDIALLEPLASVLGVTIVELLSGERMAPKVQTEELDAAARTVLDYSERQLEKTEKALAKKAVLWILCACFLLVLAVPTLNEVIRGDGFTWRCIPAYLCAQKAARAIETGEEEAIHTYIGNSEGMASALAALRDDGMEICNAKANFWQTRLDDGFLWLEVDLLVRYDGLQYQFVCKGTYREGKVELMSIISPNVGQTYPDWILELSDALGTYNPG